MLHDLEAHPAIELRTIAFGPLLSSEFGRGVDEVARSGLRIDERVECLLSSDSDVGMAKTLGLATLGFAEWVANIVAYIVVVGAMVGLNYQWELIGGEIQPTSMAHKVVLILRIYGDMSEG